MVRRSLVLFAALAFSPALPAISLDLTTRTRRAISAEQSDTIDSHLLAISVSDSFQKR